MYYVLRSDLWYAGLLEVVMSGPLTENLILSNVAAGLNQAIQCLGQSANAMYHNLKLNLICVSLPYSQLMLASSTTL